MTGWCTDQRCICRKCKNADCKGCCEHDELQCLWRLQEDEKQFCRDFISKEENHDTGRA